MELPKVTASSRVEDADLPCKTDACLYLLFVCWSLSETHRPANREKRPRVQAQMFPTFVIEIDEDY